jgi:hypothetical protein
MLCFLLEPWRSYIARTNGDEGGGSKFLHRSSGSRRRRRIANQYAMLFQGVGEVDPALQVGSLKSEIVKYCEDTSRSRTLK